MFKCSTQEENIQLYNAVKLCPYEILLGANLFPLPTSFLGEDCIRQRNTLDVCRLGCGKVEKYRDRKCRRLSSFLLYNVNSLLKTYEVTAWL